MHHREKKTSPAKGKQRSPPPLEQWQRPKPNCTSPGLPRPEASYRMLVVRYYCSYYGAFFLCEKLPLCVSCYSLVQRLCRVGGVCKAVKNYCGIRLCQGDEEREASRLEEARTIGAPLI